VQLIKVGADGAFRFFSMETTLPALDRMLTESSADEQTLKRNLSVSDGQQSHMYAKWHPAQVRVPASRFAARRQSDV